MQLLLLNREIVKMSDDEMSKKQQRAAQYRRRQVSSLFMTHNLWLILVGVNIQSIRSSNWTLLIG